MHPSFMRRSSDGQASQKRNGQGTRHGNHLPSRGLLSHNWENNHGTKIFKEGIGKGRTRDEKAQGRDSEERTIRSQGKAPQAGDRNWSFRGEGGRQEGPEGAFEEKEELQEAQGEKVVCFNRHCEEPTGPAFGGPDDKLRGEAIHSSILRQLWIASRSLSSGAHSRDPVARNDGLNLLDYFVASLPSQPREHRHRCFNSPCALAPPSGALFWRCGALFAAPGSVPAALRKPGLSGFVEAHPSG